ncbi:hypothetical protein WH96_04410 [Kiloniella spongiae]|uniref:DUF1127 domain-containing protein n=1 Tax=Kiloniella spongiae TaxID=1489064 RepID=A0A0H2MY13_9PROT|nr:hypothetical protein [Kiloniella spongiae]KLN61595.1 hypothetical protein WH96_04410 [Kiloniella spongiae]
MTHKIENTLGPEFISLADTWVSNIRSWFLARRQKNARKREIHALLSYDDKWLEEVGLSRAQLVGELGYDPRELPSVVGVVEYRFMHLSTGHNQGDKYIKRRP